MAMINCFMVWLTKESVVGLFPAAAIARGSHHGKPKQVGSRIEPIQSLIANSFEQA